MNGAIDDRERGFTLIEVLLAMVILSLGLVVLLTGASRCLAVMKISRNYQVAQYVLSLGEQQYPMTFTNDIKELEVAPEDYMDGEFKFSREVEDDDDEDDLYVVRSKVTWSERGSESMEETVRYVYQEKKK